PTVAVLVEGCDGLEIGFFCLDGTRSIAGLAVMQKMFERLKFAKEQLSAGGGAGTRSELFRRFLEVDIPTALLQQKICLQHDQPEQQTNEKIQEQQQHQHETVLSGGPAATSCAPAASSTPGNPNNSTPSTCPSFCCGRIVVSSPSSQTPTGASGGGGPRDETVQAARPEGSNASRSSCTADHADELAEAEALLTDVRREVVDHETRILSTSSQQKRGAAAAVAAACSRPSPPDGFCPEP
ncbi:unnamed protein product, partial [Amoebophrya sp. A120]